MRLRSFDLLIAGEINPDLILSDENLEPRFGQVETLVNNACLTIGSSSVIMACGAARLGLKVAFIGILGKDLFGDFMLQAMQDRNIDISSVIRDSKRQTGFSVILNRGSDRAILTYPGSISDLKIDDINDDLLKSAHHFHISSYFLQTAIQDGLPTLFQYAQELGLTTSLDTNWDPSEKWCGVNELLPFVDIFMPNINEALSLTRSLDVATALTFLSKISPYVAIKMGANGAIAKHHEQIVKLPTPVIQVKDTVGAGDSFDAGFLYGFLNNWDLSKTLALAIVCGTLSTRLAGGTNAQPSLEEAIPIVKEIEAITDAHGT